MTVASGCAMPASRPSEAIQPPKGPDRLVAANADAAKPTSVMATWMVARKSPESDARESACLARLSPSSASGSRMAFFAETTASSEAEKKPFARVSRNVTTSETTMSMRGSATSLAGNRSTIL